ncbi:hypothetical protein DM02DRAFT_673822 [Periconia macrospinosa]|uniref:Uncharacterized protein n=1 Tax=Periconia macrospinosa TaxID=97972 RepID=A0A2V1DL25_9PLEO|nr:hypothetical protein DM02DRAFT_673822 [Periconia macrospinosa]
MNMEKPASFQLMYRQNWLHFILNVLVCVVTVPYRRSFKLYTWRPLQNLRAAGNDRSVAIPLVRDFQANKYAELQSVQVAVRVVLCWGRACRVAMDKKLERDLDDRGPMVTKSILDDLPNKGELVSTLLEDDFQRTLRTILRYRKRHRTSHWVMLFLWQFPSMCMSYAWTTFIAGLTIYLCNPFIQHEPWSNRHKVAILYLCVGGFGTLAYILSLIFVYVGEKDFERSAASSRVNTNASGEDGRQAGVENDPVQITRARTVAEGGASQSGWGFGHVGPSKRQLLI